MTPLEQAIRCKLARPPLGTFRDTGAIERRNPLPVGTYWIDVFEKDFVSFDAWLKAMTVPKFVKVLAVEDVAKDDSLLLSAATLGVLGSPRVIQRWYLFRVDVPNVVFWQGPGIPTIATPDVHTASDTVQRPNVSDMTLSELLGVKLPDVVNTWTVPVTVGILGALGLGYWYVTHRSN